VSAPVVVDFGPEICGSLRTASQREWLVTNGLGGFACGTITGELARRYHGLLIAALPELGTLLLVSKVDEILRYADHDYALGANRWSSGVVEPEGFRWIERFHLAGSIPVWTYACADAVLEKRIWMHDAENTTFIRYELVYGSAPADLEIKVLVNCRDVHTTTRADAWNTVVTPVAHGLRVTVRDGAVPVYLLSDVAQAQGRSEWYRNYDLAVERERGLDSREDHLLAGIFRARLPPGGSVTIAFSTNPAPPLADRTALAAREALDQKLLEYWIAAHPRASLEAPPWIWQLVLAAGQFPVRRRAPDESERWSVLAGYPWFGEWGRDAMIALPGVALETGRLEVARSVLQEFPRFAQQGLLPNTFSDKGAPAAYNSVDATLWYVEALRQYLAHTSDLGVVRNVFGALASMIDCYVRGTRYGIHMDPADGLLYAGEPGMQVTWMDAKVGDRVITPRIGKPVEVNALWFNALGAMAGFASQLGKPADEYTRLADRVRLSFARYWNSDRHCCFDVIDGPNGNDASLRPNQIFAASLQESPLTAEQRKQVVDICALCLVTPHGLRTLDTADANYCGHYEGSPSQRDAAYHQGTVWAWLLGPFVLAHLRVYGDPQRAFAFIEPIAHHLSAAGVGSVSEIFDGEAPFIPRGAFAQAWSVAEILRAWRACHDAGLTAKSAARR
jgi:predicted glycogen debranching enzyme